MKVIEHEGTPVFSGHLPQGKRENYAKEHDESKHPRGEGGKWIKTNNEGHGFHGGRLRHHQGENELTEEHHQKAGEDFHNAAKSIMDKHGLADDIARNYLDSVHGRHLADQLHGKDVTPEGLHEGMKFVHGGGRDYSWKTGKPIDRDKKISKALEEIADETKEGYFADELELTPDDDAGVAEIETEAGYKHDAPRGFTPADKGRAAGRADQRQAKQEEEATPEPSEPKAKPSPLNDSAFQARLVRQRTEREQEAKSQRDKDAAERSRKGLRPL